MSWITELFHTSTPMIGVVHLAPLPGSPQYGGDVDEIFTRARTAARTLRDAGFDGIMFENFCDTPFFPDTVPPHVVGLLSVLVHECAQQGPCGVNMLRNAAGDALAAAFSGGGSFIRVNIHTGAALTDQGIIQGKACETLRYRRSLNASVRILADVQVKHAAPLARRSATLEAKDCVERGGADGVIVTGSRTGEPVDMVQLEEVKNAVPSTPLFVGSGASADNLASALTIADGVIVSTSLEKETGLIDPRSAAAFIKEADKHRS